MPRLADLDDGDDDINETRHLPLAPFAVSDSFESSSSSAAVLDFAELGAIEASDVPEESNQE
ncbi:hypothetical protein E2562_031878 [Oryza meyeriana var. granulata]|uniref:Uncharacterized protein n=1 Tax=Oryza meyeriana var. granulata TaxID=110450 RepID=A0A6G1F0A2_9ORYZ|nr:hypothetical protein E2562_031878 [Oryza meyeriana var. granulata]